MKLLNPLNPIHLNIEVESSENRHFMETPLESLLALHLNVRFTGPLSLMPPLCTDPWLDKSIPRVKKTPFPDRRQ